MMPKAKPRRLNCQHAKTFVAKIARKTGMENSLVHRCPYGDKSSGPAIILALLQEVNLEPVNSYQSFVSNVDRGEDYHQNIKDEVLLIKGVTNIFHDTGPFRTYFCPTEFWALIAFFMYDVCHC
jgi:hypothetical protein